MNELAEIRALIRQVGPQKTEPAAGKKDKKNSGNMKWSLDEKLLSFDGNCWTIRNACEGVVCFGATGSGKSSGPMRQLALSFLKKKFGGIVFCVKPDEKEIWEHYAEETGRTEDLMFLSKNTFNFMSYEQGRSGEGAGEVENIVHLFMEVSQVGKDKRLTATNESYWKDAVKQFLRNAVTLLMMSDDQLNLENIKGVIDSAPRESEEIEDIENNYCEFLISCIEEEKQGRKNNEFKLLKEYFNREFVQLDSKTRSNIISSFTVIVDSFLRGEMYRCFCAGNSTFRPEMIAEGKILIVDYNIKEWQKLGSYASAVIKYCFMQAIERRVADSDNVRPVFMFADECQNFAIPYDYLFQTTARSSKVITVYATQNISNLYAAYGQDQVASLLGNLGTKIFCQNGDDKTNNWASDSIGKVLLKRRSMSKAEAQSLSGQGEGHSNNESISEGWSEQKDFLVDPIVFTSLIKGSAQNKCSVGFILWQSGRIFANDKAYLKTSVKQECKLICGAKSKYKCDSLFNGAALFKRIQFSPRGIFYLAVFAGSLCCAILAKNLIITQKDMVLFGNSASWLELTLAQVLLWIFALGIFEGIEFFWNLFKGFFCHDGDEKNKRKKEFIAEYFLFYLLGATYATYHIYQRIVYDENFLNLILCLAMGAFVIKLMMALGSSKGASS